jgi:lipopolysaccharide assembly outer membrane protein LptD (OstA)
MPRQTVRYGLSNSLVAKNQGQAPAQTPDQTPDQEAGGLQTADKYFQFLKFGLFSSYELADNSNLTSRPLVDRYYDTGYYGQGSGPLEAYLETFFNPYFSARMISNFNTNTGRAINHDWSLTAADSRGDRLTLTYDYDTPEGKPGYTTGYQEARADLNLRLNSEWSTRFHTRYDLKGNQALQSTAQLAYRDQCYGLSLLYSKTYHEQSVGLLFDLMGLGSIDLSGVGASY